jgi:putative ABC transport system permease protein
MYVVLISALVVLFLMALMAPMLFWEKGRRSLVLALRSLVLHKLRAILSVLGIIIGTAAVISLMAFGEGSMQDALDDIKRMGATNIIVRSVKPPDDSATQRRSRVAMYGVTWEDYERFQTIPCVTRMVPMRVFPQEVRRLERMHNGRVVGTTPQYAEINELTLACGRFLTDEDDAHMKNVCVLGCTTAERLFPYDDPLGQSVYFGRHNYLIVGVLRERMPTGGSGGSQAAEDYNNDVYIPLRTCNVRFGERIVIRQSGSFSGEQVELSQVTLTVSDIDKVRPTGDVIRTIMARHEKADWAVTVPLDRLEEAERAKNRYKILLAVIASISLLVGGIGIMNIMLASVTERTREIGIRRALGAKRRDITTQFLIEAVVQTTIGGLLGMLLGLTIALLMPWVAHNMFQTHMPAKVHVPSIFLSLGVAFAVGIVFGLYPAWKASRLDPIEALRHE